MAGGKSEVMQGQVEFVNISHRRHLCHQWENMEGKAWHF